MSDVTRRDALKLALAAGAAAVTGCKPGPLATDGDSAHAGKSSAGAAKEKDSMPSEADPHVDPIVGLTPLRGFPWPTLDPFLFCVHHDDQYPAGNEQLGPAASLAGRDIGQDFAGKDGWRMYHGDVVPGFPQHPHRGFETVTVVRRGLLDHADSMGAAARYGEGDVQWLTAGGGIQHAEMFPLLDPQRPNPVELFQLWLNLPRRDKMVQPYFSMFWDREIPRRELSDDAGRKTLVTVVAGRYADAQPPSPPPNSWAARAEADVAIWTIKMQPGAKWTLPATQPGVNRGLYFFKGSKLAVSSAGRPARTVEPLQRVQVRSELAVQLEAGPDDTEILLLQGRPIGEPVVQHGPFVMNTREEIQQAFVDYQRTRFGGWPWPRRDPVHGKEDGRFARHADGRIESPV